MEGPLGTPPQSTTLTSLSIVTFPDTDTQKDKTSRITVESALFRYSFSTVRAFKADLDLSTHCSVVAGSPVIGTSSFIPRCLQCSTDL